MGLTLHQQKLVLYTCFSLISSGLLALFLGGLLSFVHRELGIVVFFGLFGWLFLELMIRRPKAK